MPVWRLVPIDLSDSNWQASSHRGFAVVRARTEQRAREVAEEAFAVKTRFPPRRRATPPWLRGEFVRAEIVDDPRYAPSGPEEVLEPTFRLP